MNNYPRVHPRTHVRTVLVLMAGIAMFIGGFGVQPASAHGSHANGCTGVPDSGYGFAFHSICDRHDHCYRNKPYGHDAAGRKGCDRVFRSAMLGYCERHSRYSAEGVSCRTVGRIYYGGVRLLGGSAWTSGGDVPIG